MRAWAVAAQAAGTVVYLGAVSRTYNDRPLRGFWFKQGAFVDFGRNPLRLPAETFEHLRRITEVFPGGGSRWAGILLVVAIVGLVVASVRGPHAVLARFCVATAVLAFGGAVIRRFPFGPIVNAGTTGRVSLWLVPVVAVGLAVVLTYARQATAAGSRWRFGFDALLFACAAFIMLNAIGDNKPAVHAATRHAAEQVMAEVGPRDAVWTTWPATYSLASTPTRRYDCAPIPNGRSVSSRTSSTGDCTESSEMQASATSTPSPTPSSGCSSSKLGRSGRRRPILTK